MTKTFLIVALAEVIVGLAAVYLGAARLVRWYRSRRAQPPQA